MENIIRAIKSRKGDVNMAEKIFKKIIVNGLEFRFKFKDLKFGRNGVYICMTSKKGTPEFVKAKEYIKSFHEHGFDIYDACWFIPFHCPKHCRGNHNGENEERIKKELPYIYEEFLIKYLKDNGKSYEA
jgi:hypothetical protein